jgi:stage II sporulation protein D
LILKCVKIFAILVFSIQFAYSRTLNIGVFTDNIIKNLKVVPKDSTYVIYADGEFFADIKGSKTFTIKWARENQLLLEYDGNRKIVSNVQLLGKSPQSSIGLKPLLPMLDERWYQHHFHITSTILGIKIVNVVNLDYYVAGVVESENGIRETKEFYKTKSIICRTYALNNLRRHEEEGYHLCDRVHCQVYKSKSRYNPDIFEAAINTNGQVIVDEKYKLITAAFHSNCGGQTINSEKVWTLETSYLKSTPDTFCVAQPHATWADSVGINEWINYLETKYKYNQSDSITKICLLEFEQDTTERQDYVYNHKLVIPLKDIRMDFKLKSTLFSYAPNEEGSKIIFKGRGFGHGVGLCQEGAMKMAKLGYKYDEILKYYYRNIHIVDLSIVEGLNEKQKR